MSAPVILCDTKGMTESRWLDCRMHGPKGDIPYTVGGSDFRGITVDDAAGTLEDQKRADETGR